MEGQDVHSFYVPETGGESCKLGNIVSIVGQSGHQYEAQPNRPLTGGQTTREIQDGVNLHSGKLAVASRVPTLDIQQHQLDFLQLCISEAVPQAAVGVESGMNAHRLRRGIQLYGEPLLHAWLATAQGEAPRHDLPAESILARSFGCPSGCYSEPVAPIPRGRVATL